MPLTVCYEIYLKRDGNRPIFLTRVRDATNALNIGRHQVKILNESWLKRVAWTANVVEVLIDEDRLDADEADEPLKQGDTIDDECIQRPLAGGTATSGAICTADGEAAIRAAIDNAECVVADPPK